MFIGMFAPRVRTMLPTLGCHFTGVFARIYNGPSYWQNRYDIKLAEQFQRFASGSLPNLEMRTAQVALLFLGYAPGKIDGMIGPRTRAAIKNF